MSDEKLTCCFTGHREFETATFDEVGPLIVAAVRKMHGEGYRRFLSGGARGFDLYAAAAVAALKSELSGLWVQLVLPFEGHDHSWTVLERRQLQSVRALADSVVTLAAAYGRSVYRRRNEWLVDRASAVIAFCEDGHGSGGTRGTVDYAEKRGRRVINLAKKEFIETSRERNRLLLQ